MPIETATPSEMAWVTAIPMPMQNIGWSSNTYPLRCKAKCFGSLGIWAGKDNGANAWGLAVQPSSPPPQNLRLINHFCSVVGPTALG